jgi:hypothetical protein
MKNKILLFSLLFLFSAATQAQDLVYPALKGLRSKQIASVCAGKSWDFINRTADTYLSIILLLHVAEYKKGREVIKLEIYRHADHIMAFGIYSSERSPSFNFMSLGGQGYSADGAINFFKGNYYVKVKTYSKKAKTLQAEQSLAIKVAAMLDGESTMPSILDAFPAEGRKMNEESFINESVLGHAFLNKAFKAIYQVGPDNFSVFIIQDSSPETIRKIIATYVASTGIDPVETDEGKYVISDGYNGAIFIAGKGDKIVIISGLAKDQAEIADKYTSEILK